MAGGTYVQNEAANDAADRQQAAMNAALEQSDSFSKKAEDTAMLNAQEYAPEARAQRFDTARQDAGESLAQQLTQSREKVTAPEQASGRLSEAFSTASAKSQADQLQTSLDMARAMGRVRGANDMMTEEGLINADYASQLGTIGRNAGGSMNAAGVGINAAGMPDNNQMALGGLAQGLGSAYAARNGRTTQGNGNFQPGQGYQGGGGFAWEQ
jgi:hypothetical protein